MSDPKRKYSGVTASGVIAERSEPSCRHGPASWREGGYGAMPGGGTPFRQDRKEPGPDEVETRVSSTSRRSRHHSVTSEAGPSNYWLFLVYG